MPPSEQKLRLPGAWNHCTVLAKDSRLFVILNGTQIIDMDLNRWTESGRNPDGTPNPLRKACRDLPRKGVIGFQCWNPKVAYRAVRIKPLGDDAGGE